jgi:hypothetical protein
VPILDDLHKVLPLLDGNALHAPIVKNQKLRAEQLGKQARVGTVAVGNA